jgi:hypothetical protein
MLKCRGEIGRRRRFFGQEKKYQNIKKKYKIYFKSSVLHIALVAPFFFGFIIYRFEDTLLGVIVIGYFASERLADEAQRFLIFANRRKEWGYRIMAKTVLQILGIGIAVEIFESSAIHWSVLALMIGNLIGYGSKMPYRYLTFQNSELKILIKTTIYQRKFWILSIITTVISYLDRIVVMLFQQTDLAFYTILVSSISIIQNAVDYFFVSLKRKEILQGQIHLKQIFFNHRFYLILSIASIAGLLVSWIMLRLYHSNEIVNFELIPIVLISQITLSITLLIREIIYWNYSIRHLIILDFIFILLVIITAYLINFAGFNYKFVLIGICFLLIFRLLTMIREILKNKKFKSNENFF